MHTGRVGNYVIDNMHQTGPFVAAVLAVVEAVALWSPVDAVQVVALELVVGATSCTGRVSHETLQ